MQLKSRQTRALALLTGGIIAATTFLQPAPAHADKAKTYKYGAIGLGVLGAVLLSKGKTLPAVAAVAGGYYAYKKGQDAKSDDNRYGSYPRKPTYPGYGGNGYTSNNGYNNNGYGTSYGSNAGYASNSGNGSNYGYGSNTGYSSSGNGRGDANCNNQSANGYTNGYDNRGSNNSGYDNRAEYRANARYQDRRNDSGNNYDVSPYLR